uniref:Small EDRK-rich factor-like N-terminal domain-containing protein n=1 Tax=Acrobeloides nanus TaxID=290746 RepID=A0A914CI10_9BILA
MITGFERPEKAQSAKSNGIKGNRDVQKSSKNHEQAQKEGVDQKSRRDKDSKQGKKLVTTPASGEQENILRK